MPPLLALTFCSFFVFYLLSLDRKQAPKVSIALWIPTIWMLIIASKPLAVWFGSSAAQIEIGAAEVDAGSPMDRACFSLLLCLGLLILVKRQFKWASAIKAIPWAISLIVFILVSILWSDLQYLSFKRSMRELVAIVMAFMVASEPDSRQALQCIFRRLIYILIPFSLLLIKYYPQLGVEYGRYDGQLMWIGVANQKNSLSLLCLFSLFFLIWTFIRRGQGRDISVVRFHTHLEVVIFILAAWLIMGPKHTPTYSATSSFTLVFGLAALICFLWMKKLNMSIGANALTVVVIIIIVYGTITPFLGSLTLFDVSSFLGRDETLTGRSEIWSRLIPYVMQKPIVGHGFGGFWTEEMQARINTSAHNGYLDQIVNLGFVGYFLFSMFLVSCCRRAQREMTMDFDWALLWICILLMALIHNISESTMTSFTSLLSAAILFLLISATAVPSETPRVSQEEGPILGNGIGRQKSFG